MFFCDRLVITKPQQMVHFSSPVQNFIFSPSLQKPYTFPIEEDPGIQFLQSILTRHGEFLQPKSDKTLLFFLPKSRCVNLALFLNKTITLQSGNEKFEVPLGALLLHLYEKFPQLIKQLQFTGSVVYDLCGVEGFKEYFGNIGCKDIFDEQLSNFISSSAIDTDICFEIPDASFEEGKAMTQCAIDFILSYHKQKVSQKGQKQTEALQNFYQIKPYNTGIESGFCLSFGGHEKKEIDLIFSIQSLRSHICNADHVVMQINANTLSTMVHGNQNDIENCSVAVVGNFFSFAEKASKVFDDTDIKKLNTIGAIRLFSYEAKGYVIPNSLLKQQLLNKVSARLPVGGEKFQKLKDYQLKCMQPFCAVQKNHLPSTVGGESAFVYALLQAYRDKEENKFIDQFCRKQLLQASEAKKSCLGAIHSILYDAKMDVVSLSAFLSIHSQMLSLRKKNLNQSCCIEVFKHNACNSPQLKIGFKENDKTLYFHTHNNTIENLKKLKIEQNVDLNKDDLKTIESHFFDSSKPLKLSQNSNEEYAFDQEEIELQASFALEFLKIPHLQLIGYSLLCHCCRLTKSTYYFSQISQALFSLFPKEENSKIRQAMVMLFFDCCKTIAPQSFKLSKKEYRHIASFENDTTEKNKSLSLCLILSCIDDAELFQSLYKLWKTLTKKGEVETSQEIFKLFYTNKLKHPQRALMLLQSYIKDADKSSSFKVGLKLFPAICQKFQGKDLRVKKAQILLALEAIAISNCNAPANCFDTCDPEPYLWLVEELLTVFPLDAYNLLKKLQKLFKNQNILKRKEAIWQKLFKIHINDKSSEKDVKIWQHIRKSLEFIPKTKENMQKFQSQFTKFYEAQSKNFCEKSVELWPLLFDNFLELNTTKLVNEKIVVTQIVRWVDTVNSYKFPLKIKTVDSIFELLLKTQKIDFAAKIGLSQCISNFVKNYYPEKLLHKTEQSLLPLLSWFCKNCKNALYVDPKNALSIIDLFQNLCLIKNPSDLSLSEEAFNAFSQALQDKSFDKGAVDKLYSFLEARNKAAYRSSKPLFTLYLSIASAYLQQQNPKDCLAALKSCINMYNGIKDKCVFDSEKMIGVFFECEKAFYAEKNLSSAIEVLKYLDTHLAKTTEALRAKRWQEIAIALGETSLDTARQILLDKACLIAPLEKTEDFEKLLRSLYSKYIQAPKNIEQHYTLIENYGCSNPEFWQTTIAKLMDHDNKILTHLLLFFEKENLQNTAPVWKAFFSAIEKKSAPFFIHFLQDLEKFVIVIERQKPVEQIPLCTLLATQLLKILHIPKYRKDYFYRVYKAYKLIKKSAPKEAITDNVQLLFAETFFRTRNPKVYSTVIESLKDLFFKHNADPFYINLLTEVFQQYTKLSNDEDENIALKLWDFAIEQSNLNNLGLAPFIKLFSSDLFYEENIELTERFLNAFSSSKTPLSSNTLKIVKESIQQLHKKFFKINHLFYPPTHFLSQTSVKQLFNPQEYAIEWGKFLNFELQESREKIRGQKIKLFFAKQQNDENAINIEKGLLKKRQEDAVKVLNFYKDVRIDLQKDQESHEKCAKNLFSLLVHLNDEGFQHPLEQYRDFFYKIVDTEKAQSRIALLNEAFLATLKNLYITSNASMKSYLLKFDENALSKESFLSASAEICDPATFDFLKGLTETVLDSLKTPLKDGENIKFDFWIEIFFLLELFPQKAEEIYLLIFEFAFIYFPFDKASYYEQVNKVLVLGNYIHAITDIEMPKEMQLQLLLLKKFKTVYNSDEQLIKVEKNLRINMIQKLTSNGCILHFDTAASILADFQELLKDNPEEFFIAYSYLFDNFKTLQHEGKNVVLLEKLFQNINLINLHIQFISKPLKEVFKKLFLKYFECLAHLSDLGFPLQAKEMACKSFKKIQLLPWVINQKYKVSLCYIDGKNISLLFEE